MGLLPLILEVIPLLELKFASEYFPNLGSPSTLDKSGKNLKQNPCSSLTARLLRGGGKKLSMFHNLGFKLCPSNN